MIHSELPRTDSQVNDNLSTVARSNCSTWNIALGIFFLVCLGLIGCSEEKPQNYLRVGMDLSYPPFETINEAGQPCGVSVDLAQAFADSLQRPLQIENIPFTGLIPSLNTGRVDCVISSMTETAERSKAVTFSKPYLTIGLAVLVGANSDIRSPADLDQPGRTVAVRQGTTGEVWARRELKQAKVLALEKENTAVLEVVQGKADAFIYDQMSIWQNAQRHPDMTRAILTPLREESWAVAVKLGNEALRDQINTFLEAFRAQGGFDALGDTYLKDQKDAFANEGLPFYF